MAESLNRKKNDAVIFTQMISFPPIPPDEVKDGAKVCTFDNEDGCLFNFTYRYTGVGTDGKPNYKISVQKELQCPEPPNVLG